MSTRATIKIEGVTFAKVYKHWDGYPDATLEWLETFNKDFTKNRGVDPEYKFAQLLRNSTLLYGSPYTGWGVVPYDTNMGQEYVYLLRSDGTVTYEKL